MPVGQSIRTVNPWRSYMNDSSAHASTASIGTAKPKGVDSTKTPSTTTRKKKAKARKKAKGEAVVDLKENDIYRDYIK